MNVIKRIAVSTTIIAAFFVSTALFGLSVVQAADRLIKITTLEPETERDGTCDPPTLRGEPLELLPPELEGLRGYTQECTPGAGSGDPGSDRADLWELGTNRFLPNTIVVNKHDMVTLEFYGIRGRDHNIQVFRPGYQTIIKGDGTEGISGIGADTCTPSIIGPNGQPCFFTAKRGEVTDITLFVDQHGAWLIHCHTHGTAMQADLIVLKSATP